jgi:hypothetical protein
MAAENNNSFSASWADRSECSSENVPECSSARARFFIIKLAEGDFSKISPFLIHKSLQAKIGDAKSVKKLRSGELLVEVSTTKQAMILSTLKSLGNLAVVVSAHRTLNFSKGVISEPDLQYISESEILENLKDQLVCAVRKITIRRDGKVSPTKHTILTFSSPTLPPHINAGYLRCPVRPYVPNPLRCFKCQRFGHSKFSCRGSTTCARCAVVGHDSEKCNNEKTVCVNCKGEHPSFSRLCPSWQAEKEVQVLKHEKGLSYGEARKLINSRTPKSGISYSSAIANKSVRSIATQTEPSPIKKKIITQAPTITSVKASKNKEKATETQLDFSSNNKAPKSNTNNEASNKVKSKKRSRTKHNPSKTAPYDLKNLTRNDFLKNRPNITLIEECDIDDPLKVYVSTEEDMLTSGASDLEVDTSTSVQG